MIQHRFGRTFAFFAIITAFACSKKEIGFIYVDGGSPTTDGGTPGPDGPTVGARIITPVATPKVTKIDLLFMVDNSASMADKQAILAYAVPDLVSRLVDPVCINRMTGQQVGVRRPDGSCAVGEPDFDPIKDIHVGMITSSLGGHGSIGVCDDPDPRKTFAHNDDHGHLVARDAMDMPVPTFMNLGFLNWNPVANPAQNPNDIVLPFSTMVAGVGQHGCGYEASLEAIYRFLIDPDPYQAVKVVPSGSTTGPGVAVLDGIDTALLKQRSDFLRPDSIVAVVAMTDENDCSIQDTGQAFYSIVPPSGGESLLAHGTTQCLANPNDPCCYNCQQSPPNGCPEPMLDPECAKGRWTQPLDPPNLRCWAQKRRYGVDFLYPIQRYVSGFTNQNLSNRSGQQVKNPLYDDLSSACASSHQCAPQRDRSLVIFEGIIGVPWQDIAVDPQNPSKGFLTAAELTANGVWSKILGDPGANPPIEPSDPHMLESIVPRPGLAGPASPANADPIHGHEWDPSMGIPQANADLQYACVFNLPMSKTCTEQADCDCFVPPSADPAAPKNPLCQNAMNQYSNVQVRAKAYPGIRQLQVLQGLGDQGVVASICASNVSNLSAADFGYRQAVAALVGRIRPILRGRCFPRSLPINPVTGNVPCHVLEVFDPTAADCRCDDFPARHLASSDLFVPELRAYGTCACEIEQTKGADLDACLTEVNPPASASGGWCYVDPAQASTAARSAECELVRSCPADDRRIIRFVSPPSEPRPGSRGFIMCDENSGTPPSSAEPCP